MVVKFDIARFNLQRCLAASTKKAVVVVCSRTHYEVMGVGSKAKRAVIHSAFKRHAKKYQRKEKKCGLDKNKKRAVLQAFLDLKKAHDVLLNENLRAEYDRILERCDASSSLAALDDDGNDHMQPNAVKASVFHDCTEDGDSTDDTESVSDESFSDESNVSIRTTDGAIDLDESSTDSSETMVIFGLNKDGQPCGTCFRLNRFCHLHKRQDPSSPNYKPWRPNPVVYGITKKGEPCKLCLRVGDFCWMHRINPET